MLASTTLPFSNVYGFHGVLVWVAPCVWVIASASKRLKVVCPGRKAHQIIPYYLNLTNVIAAHDILQGSFHLLSIKPMACRLHERVGAASRHIVVSSSLVIRQLTLSHCPCCISGVLAADARQFLINSLAASFSQSRRKMCEVWQIA